MNVASIEQVIRRRATGPPDVPGGPPDGDRPGGGDGWCLLTVADNQIQAHLLSGILEEHGVECFLDGFNAAPGAWLKPFGDPLAPVRVLVRRRDRQSASLLLHELGHQPGRPAERRANLSRAELLAALGVLLVVALLTVLEIFGDTPCALGVYCS